MQVEGLLILGKNVKTMVPLLSISAWIPELIPVFGSQPTGDRSRNPCGRLPLLSTVTLPSSITALWPVPNYTAW